MAELETTTGLDPFCFEKNAPVPLAEKYPLLPVQNSKLPGIFGNSQIPRFARMKKPNSVEHDENGIGELLVTSPICAETKQNGSRIALRSRLKG